MLKYEIVLVPFPFDDLLSSKVRPAVCLTEPIGPHQHVVLAFITSRTQPEPLFTDMLIAEEDAGFGETGLRVSSMLRLHRLMTVSTTIFKRKLGGLPENLQEEADSRLRLLFDV